MALPKLTTPTYELEIPSTDEKIKYRPFLVKEEKILMMAMETKNESDIVQAVKDIVSECTFNKVNLGTMPMFDVEYIFLNIRAKSVGEVSKLKVLCQDDMKTYAKVEVDLNEIQVQVEDGHTNKKLYNLVQHEETRIKKGRPPISKAVLNENRVFTTNRAKEVQLSNAPIYESSPISRSSLLHKKCTSL